MAISIKFIEEILKTKKYGDGTSELNVISIHSKNIIPGSCFIAIVGSKSNGNEYIKEALKNGASAIIMDKEYLNIYENECKEFHANSWCIAIENVVDSLLKLAENWKKLFNVITIGITGTIGKTTTKECIGHLLRCAGQNPLVTKDSQNSKLGVALTLLRLREEHTVIVCEIGISEIGEMEKLASILNPNIAIVTMISKVHLRGLKDLETIANEKCKIFDFLKKDGFAVINGDIPQLTRRIYEKKLIMYGRGKNNHIRFGAISYGDNCSRSVCSIMNKSFAVKLNSIHGGFIYNVLSAVSAVYSFNIQNDILKKAIESFFPLPSRFCVIPSTKWTGKIIDDSYNASPESVKKSLYTFDKMNKKTKKIVVLGNLLDLGDYGTHINREIIKFLKSCESITKCILVGDLISQFESEVPLWMDVDTFSTWDESVPNVEKLLKRGFDVLIKGANSQQLWNIVSAIDEEAYQNYKKNFNFYE